MAEIGIVAATACDPIGGASVLAALSASHEPPAPTVGNVAQLFDVDVYQRARVIVFIASYRFPGTDIDVRQPVQSMCDNRFSRHRTNTACTVEAGIDSREAIANGDSRCFHRRCTILRTTTCPVR